ncbi:hypothetical protein [Streptosporangium saharense]|uniref:Fatty acid desaturase n=1 Tax=Streptosporangium saharense TaxID=1706840 RepID=A0A7W7VNY1_9ACTN|nr:hypothetical protein [Streptosporangium saharense]MBB4917386.1 fatty acid desaturase [Streptosporangium saharense]
MSTTTRATVPDVRWLLRLDAGLETVLTVVCVILAYGLLGTDRWRVPSWLSTPVLLVVAIALLLAAALLWWLSDRPIPAAVRAVAVANGVTALAFLTWAIIGLGADVRLRVLLAVTAVLLGVLATTQFSWTIRPSGENTS